MGKAEKAIKMLLFSLLTACLLYCLYRQGVSDILVVFAYVVFFSLILSPVCRRLEKAGLPSSAASALSIVLVIGVLLLFFFLLFPYLLRRTVDLLSRCLPVLQTLMLSAEETLQTIGFSGMNMLSLAGDFISSAARMAGSFARGGLSIVAETGKMMFSLVIAYYVLKERAAAGYSALLFVPSVFREPALSLMKACKYAVMSYLGGLLKTCAFIGITTGIALTLLGIGDAVILGALMGLLEVIPYIGPVLGAIPILLSAIPLGFHKTILSLVLIILIQQAESSFIGPYFTSSSTSVHPLAALLGVYVLGSIFGVWGIILAIPAIVVLRNMMWSLVQFRDIQKAEESIET